MSPRDLTEKRGKSANLSDPPPNAPRTERVKTAFERCGRRASGLIEFNRGEFTFYKGRRRERVYFPSVDHHARIRHAQSHYRHLDDGD